MRFWSRLALIVWLLTGLLTAPAMAFGMACHGGMDTMAMAADAPMTMQMSHKSMPHMAQDKVDMSHKAFSCAVHCLNAGAGLLLQQPTRIKSASAGVVLPHFPPAPLTGQFPGPLLEPPISALV